MDCDDNDFQSQNFQLAGEDSRFSQSLRSFSLPKFDFDDQLQIQLRHDSLTEIKSLYGMQGQEDNWIEEFSPRHSAIEFSSSAAESCSISRHNHVWSEATSSESVEILLQSVNEDEMVNKKTMINDSDKVAYDTNCITETIIHNDEVLPPDECQNSLLDSNVLGVEKQDGGTSHVIEVGKSEMELDLGLDERLGYPEKVITEECINDENLESVTDVAIKECVVDQFLEVVQSDDPLGNESPRNNLSDNCCCPGRNDSKSSPELLDYSTQDGPSAISVNSTSIESENIKKGSFSEQVVELCHEIGIKAESESIQPDSEQKDMIHIFSVDSKVNDQHFEDHVVNNDACNVTDSSDFEVSSGSVTMRNKGACDSSFPENSDGLLESFAYQVNAVSNGSRTDDKILLCIKELPSKAVERTCGVERSNVEVGMEDATELTNTKGDSKDFAQSVQECLPEDHLNGNTLLIEDIKMVGFTEGEHANSKAAIADRQEGNTLLPDKSCSKLMTSSAMEVGQKLSTLMKPEEKVSEVTDVGDDKIQLLSSITSDCCITEKPAKGDLTEVNDDGDDRIHPLISISSDSCRIDEPSKDDVKDISNKSNSKFGISGHSGAENSPALDNDEHISTSFSTEGTSIRMSHIDNVAKLNEYNAISVEPSSFVKDKIAVSLDLCCTNSNDNSSVVMEKDSSSSSAQPGSAKDESSIEKSCADEAIKDVASVDVPSNSPAAQCLQLEMLPSTTGVLEEKEATAVTLLPASNCIEDSNISVSVGKNYLDTLTSSELLARPDSAIHGSSTKNSLDENGGTIINDEVCASAVNSSFGTIISADQPEEAKLASEEVCDGQNITETNDNALNSSNNNYSEIIAPRSKIESTSLLNPEIGNESSFEANCGSPTVISCNEHSQSGVDFREDYRELPGPDGPSSDAANDMDQVKCPSDQQVRSASETDGSFTFEVQSVENMSRKDTGKDWKPFSKEQSPELAQISGAGQNNSKGENMHGTIIKAIDEDKKTQASKSENRKAGSSKGEFKAKSREKQVKGKERNSCSMTPISDRTIISKIQTEVTQQYPCSESSNTKLSCSPPIQSSNLPDLNSSVSSAALRHQPFTDLQQVQLRAQIFVYGSLIQGVPPDEAFMMSAFGGTDGGRSLWEGSLRAALGRFPLQKSATLGSLETPVHSRSGVSVTEEASNSSSLHSKALNSPAGWNANKVMSSAIVNSAVSWPSPLWSKSCTDSLPSSVPRATHLEFNQSVSPLYAYQSTHSKQYTNNATTWLSQNTQPPSWVFSSQNSPFDPSTQYSSTPLGEIVQVTPVRDSSVPHAPNMHLTSPGNSLRNECPGTLSAALVLHNEPQKTSASPSSIKNENTGKKSRRRKKVTAPQELGPTSPVSQPQSEIASAAVVTKRITTSASFALPTNHTNAVTSSCLVSAFTSHLTSPTNFQVRSSADFQQSVLISETVMGTEQSKLEAENASAQAAAAIKHSQDVWSKLAAQRESSLDLEVEQKLASAAVAAAAAASVAKAAAEAAKLASEAALQAKMMADEALNAVQTGSTAQETDMTLDIGKKLARLSHVSILKGKDNIDGSNPVISAARQAARKRVDAASAAIKRAENLDALLKAAELAVEAVSQAGTIIAMGDPLPFSICELAEAGPEGYWKVQHAANGSIRGANDVQAVESLGSDHDIYVNQSVGEPSSHKEKQKVPKEGGMCTSSEPSMLPEENLGGMDAGNTSKAVATDELARNSSVDNTYGSNIREGSLVEVASTKDGLQGVWFPASVLDLKDGKAYVCYTDLLSDEGHAQLEEWIPIEYHNNKAPRIRVAHPLAKSEGTRKRRREALGNYAWAVGDMVDAWIRGSWREGIITDKSLEDETKLTVRFPASGDSAVVRAWNLRPSLIWKDGQWLEWTRIRGRDTLEAHQGDTPLEKRQKKSLLEAKSNPDMDKSGAKTIFNIVHMNDSRKLEESSTLNLSENEKIFSAGKNGKEEEITTAHNVKRTGLHKGGLGVIIGVPKPGKKRKFMEVSKHYISDKTDKLIEGGDSTKFTKYLMPQASHLWKNTSKVDVKGKQATNSRPRGLKSLRSQNVHATRVERGNSSVTTVSAVNGGESGLSSSLNLRSSFSKEDGNGKKKPSPEAASFPSILGKADIPVVESSMPSMPSIPVISTSKKKSSATIEETGRKGKDLPATDQSTSPGDKASEFPAKTAAEVIEPRRSNRRIQPTSRLLEGLQSSLIMSKIPSISHDKGAKSMHRGASCSRGQSHG